ncbi:MAG: S8 family serine peptidase [Desulfobulbaceae bacterium]|nr:S8 family serine peptidase [Desulfobulbaceae bacterium]
MNVKNSNKIPERIIEPGVNWERIIIILLIVALIILAIWALLRPEKIITPEPEFFARNQVVIVGTENLDDIINAVSDSLEIQLLRVELEAIEPPDFLQRSTDNDIEQLGTKYNNQTGAAKSFTSLYALQTNGEDESEVNLYQIVPNDPSKEVSPEEVAASVNEQAANMGVAVVSDPNYLIGRPAIEIEGDPHSSEGVAVSSPLSGGAKIEFLNQWALDERGIQLFTSETISENVRPESGVPDNVNGDGVFVIMFDTSPFDLDRLAVDFANTNVQHYEVAGIPDARDHGVFGASLVNVIASESTIVIYRVLNESNRGDLATLLRALDSLLVEYRDTPEDQRPPLVVNMSLTVSFPPIEEGQDDSYPIDETDATPAPAITIGTLENKLQELYELGVVIVAAAGNDSSQQSRDGLPAQGAGIPASYSFVIGVGASNVGGGMSCFSNSGNIYAPGGDNGAQCSLNVFECRNDSNSCVIGYSVHTSPVTNYAYWNGTSFSAPMVSGVAALLLGIDNDPTKVYNILMPSTAAEGIGLPIIDVNEAVEEMQ